MECGCRDV